MALEWINALGQLGVGTLLVILLAKHAPKAIAAWTAIATSLGGMRSDLTHTKDEARGAKEAAGKAEAASNSTKAAVKELTRELRGRGPLSSDPERAPASRPRSPAGLALGSE